MSPSDATSFFSPAISPLKGEERRGRHDQPVATPRHPAACSVKQVGEDGALIAIRGPKNADGDGGAAARGEAAAGLQLLEQLDVARLLLELLELAKTRTARDDVRGAGADAAARGHRLP